MGTIRPPKDANLRKNLRKYSMESGVHQSL